MLDDLDRKILKLLKGNARMAFSEIARHLGMSSAGVQQRVQKMVAHGSISNFETEIAPSELGYQACAIVGANVVDRSSVDQLIDKLKAIPTITECHFTTGHHDIMLTLYGRNNDDIFNQLLRLQQLGLSNTVTLISFRHAFSRPLPIEQ